MKFDIDLEFADGNGVRTSTTSTIVADGNTKFDNGILFEGDERPHLRQPRKLEGKPMRT